MAAEVAGRRDNSARRKDTSTDGRDSRAFLTLVVWLIGGTALGLVEMAIVGARPDVDFSGYSLLEFMAYYWVPSAVGGLLLWVGLIVAARLFGRNPNGLTWGGGLFAATAVFVYAGLTVNGWIKGPPFTPRAIAANVGVLAAAVITGFVVAGVFRRVNAALAGRRGARLALAALCAVALVLLAWSWGNVNVGFVDKAIPADDARRPNVILITVDALRADHLPMNGYGRQTAPFLTRLAEEGANFHSAFSQATITVRSMASLFTSLYPQMHGLMSSGLRISDSIPTLPEVLSDIGYATAGFGGGNPSLFHDAGIVRGFDYYDDCRSIWALVPQKILTRVGLVSRLDVGSARTTPPAEVVFNKARSWMRWSPGRPLFLFIHLMDVHAPYLPPDGYGDRFGRRAEGAPTDHRLNARCNALSLGKSEQFFELVEAGEFHRMNELDFALEDIGEGNLKRLIDLYDGAIAYVDSQLESFFEELAGQGISDETLVVVTADHGEGFLDHGRLFHSGDLVYDELMRVPLVMRYPGVISPGTRIGAPVGLVDVMPTVVELAGGCDGSTGAWQRGLEGESLLPLLLGDDKDRVLREGGEVYCEGALVSCVRTSSWKYIDSVGHNSKELYDLANDPGERVNLFDRREGRAQELVGRLEAYAERVRRYQEGHPGPTPIVVDEETRKRLRALGYVK